MKINKLAIAAFGLGIVISLVSCDSASPKVLPDSEKTVNGITSAGPEGAASGGREGIGVGVIEKIAAPGEDNSFQIGDAVTCEGVSGSKVKYTVTKAEIFESIEESNLQSDDFIQGVDEAIVRFEGQNGEASFLVLTVDAEAIADMQIELVNGRTDIHLIEFKLFYEDKPLGDAVYFQGGDESYKKDKKKTYYYFAAPVGKSVTLKAGYLVPEGWEEQNSLMLGIGTDLQKLSFVILDKDKVGKENR